MSLIEKFLEMANDDKVDIDIEPLLETKEDKVVFEKWFKIFMELEPVAIVPTLEKMSKTYIMTARRGNSLGPILDYIQQIGINSSQVRPIATEGESKGDVMVAMMRNKIMADGKSNIRRIEYYEDSQRNIDDVLSKICDNDAINDIKPEDFELIIYKVIKSADNYTLQEIRC